MGSTFNDGSPVASVADNRLTTVDLIKVYMRIPSATTKHDALLLQLLDEVEDDVKRYMRMDLVWTTYDSDNAGAIVMDGSGRDALILPHQPFWTVTSVRYAESDGTFPAANEVDSDIYRLDQEAAILSRQGAGDAWVRGSIDGGQWTCGFNNWQIEGTAGWKGPNQTGVPTTVDDVPKTFQAGIHECVADRFARSGQVASGQPQMELASETVPGQMTASYRKELDDLTGFPKIAKAKFDKFRTRF